MVTAGPLDRLLLTLIVALRAAAVEATLNVNEELLPLAVVPPEDGKVTNAELLTALKDAQGGMLKFRVPLPPDGPKVKLVGETVNAVQGAANCVTVNTELAVAKPPLLSTVKVPMRCAPVFGATV